MSMTERGLARKGIYLCRQCGQPMYDGYGKKFCSKCRITRQNEQQKGYNLKAKLKKVRE